jgi:hypothetical protein
VHPHGPGDRLVLVDFGHAVPIECAVLLEAFLLRPNGNAFGLLLGAHAHVEGDPLAKTPPESAFRPIAFSSEIT